MSRQFGTGSKTSEKQHKSPPWKPLMKDNIAFEDTSSLGHTWLAWYSKWTTLRQEKLSNAQQMPTDEVTCNLPGEEYSPT